MQKIIAKISSPIRYVRLYINNNMYNEHFSLIGAVREYDPL